MKRILSIDFDYFIDTDIHTRNNEFPDGEDLIDEVNYLWSDHYQMFPNIKKIGVIPAFDYYCKTLNSLTKGEVFIAESHRDIAHILSKVDGHEGLEVINVDFHHDNYISGGNNLDCANWVRHLMNFKPDTNFTWVKREDSESVSLMGSFPYPMTEDYTIEGEFDYIFICFSPEWTPPHLLEYFDTLCDSVKHLSNI